MKKHLQFSILYAIIVSAQLKRAPREDLKKIKTLRMKDMKKRIIALVLVVVMSVLSLASCGSFNFAKEDLSNYAEFNYEEFKKALASLEIEDGDFTTNEELRQKKVLATVYDKIADAIVAAAKDEDKKESGTIGAGDVLYYVYYAEDADGNVYFYSEMKESAITASSTKADHVIELGGIDLEDEDADEIKKLIKKNLVADADLADYVYSMLTATEIEDKAEEDLKAEKAESTEGTETTEPTEDEIKAAVDEALKVKEGDRIVISYNRNYKKVAEDGTETNVTESAVSEAIVVDAANPFHNMFIAEHSVAKVGGTLAVFDKMGEDEKPVTKSTFDVVDGDITYTYSNVKILYKVENEGKVISTFKYTFEKDKNVTPDNCRSTNAGKVNLKDKELTYYVYPVYAISAPAADEIKGSDILEWVTGAKITAESFEVFEDDGFVYEGVKLPELVADLVSIYDAEEEDNEFYADGTDLKKAYDEYMKAVEDGGSSPTTAQKDTINDKKKVYNDLQKVEAKKIYAKIDAAVKGDESASDAIIKEYSEDTYHTLKETYDSTITESVQEAVWELIEKSVKVNFYPEKLVKEYKKHIYDSYEYEYYKGTASSGSSTTTTEVSNYDKYESLDAYILEQLKLSSADEIDAAIEKQAKAYIEPIIKIYVVAKACEADALAAMPGYIQQDIDAGAYEVDEHSYEETYGDAAAEKIEEAKKNAEENKTAAIEDAKSFIIDDAFIREYKKNVGRAYYRQLVNDYGEINLRASFQFNKLFYYLTSTNIEMSEHDGHMHSESKYVTIDGVDYIDFRTVKYTIAEDAEDAE